MLCYTPWKQHKYFWLLSTTCDDQEICNAMTQPGITEGYYHDEPRGLSLNLSLSQNCFVRPIKASQGIGLSDWLIGIKPQSFPWSECQIWIRVYSLEFQYAFCHLQKRRITAWWRAEQDYFSMRRMGGSKIKPPTLSLSPFNISSSVINNAEELNSLHA